MGKPTGFLEFPRVDRRYAPIPDRLVHYQEFLVPLSDGELRNQGARCMDCGIPFCHQGCPVNNLIPDWNDLVFKEDWQTACERLHSTNNFPEFTGRICPAPCEASCTLNLQDVPVTIKTIECAIVDKGWEQGWIRPLVAPKHTGKRIAVVGSGPAGLACAQQLARAGHQVRVLEKEDRIGGLLRYGIPDFKLDKGIIDRRLEQMRAEGVVFETGVEVGVTISADQLRADCDALVLAMGSEQPRDLPVPGRELDGVCFAMDFLKGNSRWVQNGMDSPEPPIHAKGKQVLVIGGGDTGSDCIGTSNRHGALSVTQIEILPQPPERENKDLTWPDWPTRMRTSSSQEEGCTRLWSVATKEFVGDAQGRVQAARCVKLAWEQDSQGRWTMEEIAGSEFEIPCQLVTLAMGFVHPVRAGLVAQLMDEGLALDPRGNVAADTDGAGAYHTNVPGLFSAGDARRGQSLVVWAIREGRQCARAVDEWLMGSSKLPR